MADRTDPRHVAGTAGERDDQTRRANRLLEDRGVRFGGDDGHAFRVDPVPRLVDHDEWQHLAEGVRQRVRALDAFVADVYGERTCVESGIVPDWVLISTPYLEPDLQGLAPRNGAWVSVAGLDIVRDVDGRLLVLEDNVRTPSGIAYAAAASDAVAQTLDVEPSTTIESDAPAALRRCLEASHPDAEGVLVLLTDGPANSAYYEHRQLAHAAGLNLATPAELRRTGDRLALADGRAVRAVYRRTEEDRVCVDGRRTEVADLLLDPWRAGRVGMVNCFGTGVADDKSVYAYVGDLIRYFLDEEPLLASVRTYDLSDEPRLEEALDRLDELVAKPRDGAGGHGVVVGPVASPDELAAAREAMRRDPRRWIVQDVVSLSTQPTIVDGEVAPRHVDLRPFAFYDGDQVTVPTGGLTRVALADGEVVVNSSRDGGAKATWVE